MVCLAACESIFMPRAVRPAVVAGPIETILILLLFIRTVGICSKNPATADGLAKLSQLIFFELIC